MWCSVPRTLSCDWFDYASCKKIFFASVGGGYGGDEGGWRGGGDGEEREWVSRDWIREARGSIVNKHVELQQGTIISTVDY